MKGIIQNVIIYKCLKLHILISSLMVRSSKKKKMCGTVTVCQILLATIRKVKINWRAVPLK